MKRYLILTYCLIICLSLLVSCGQIELSSSIEENIENEATSEIYEPVGDASGDASGEASETAETTSIEEGSSDIEEKIEAIKNWKDIGKIYVDGELIDINKHIYLRVAEGSSHEIKLLDFDKIDQNIKYEWNHFNVISVNNEIEAIETGEIHKKESYYVCINTNIDKNELEHVYGYIPDKYQHINIYFHFSVENHFRIYPAGVEDTNAEQFISSSTEHYMPDDLDGAFTKYVSVYLPDDMDSLTYTVEAYADNMDGITYEWFQYGHENEFEYVEGRNQTPSITLTQEDIENSIGRGFRECKVTDRYGNVLFLGFQYFRNEEQLSWNNIPTYILNYD